MPRALIIGGGLIGLLTARALRRRGWSAELYERGEIGRSASWAGGGILSPLYPWRVPDAVNVLARLSMQAWPGLADELHRVTGIDPEYRPGGMLVIDDDDPVEVAAWAARLGVALERPEPRAAAALEPDIVLPAGGLFRLPAVASIRNPRVLRGVRGVAAGEGVSLHEYAPVRRIEVDGAHLRGIRIEQESISADAVIVCAGAWSATLLEDSGIAAPAIRPLRGQMLRFADVPARLHQVVLARGRYLIPRRDGSVLAGSTVEDAGFECVTTETARAGLEVFARELMPALVGCEVTDHWAGLRPGTPDDVPIIGAHPEIPGLWINAGHSRSGLATAPASAELLAALINEDTPAMDPRSCAWPDFRTAT